MFVTLHDRHEPFDRLASGLCDFIAARARDAVTDVGPIGIRLRKFRDGEGREERR